MVCPKCACETLQVIRVIRSKSLHDSDKRVVQCRACNTQLLTTTIIECFVKYNIDLKRYESIEQKKRQTNLFEVNDES